MRYRNRCDQYPQEEWREQRVEGGSRAQKGQPDDGGGDIGRNVTSERRRRANTE